MLRNKLKTQSAKTGKTATQNSTLRLRSGLMVSVVEPSKLLVLSFALCVLCFALSFAQEQFVYDAQRKRNPFMPLLTSDGRFLKLEEGEAPEGLLLEGIIYDKHGRSFAIVNGTVVGVGDSVGDYQILKVEETRVLFIKDGEPKEIELKKEEP